MFGTMLLHATAVHDKQCRGGINKPFPLTGESSTFEAMALDFRLIGRRLGSNDNEFL